LLDRVRLPISWGRSFSEGRIKGIKDFLEDLNPQLLNTITSEFAKVDGNAVPEPSRTSADVVSMISSASPSKVSIPGMGDPLDDLFPRVELDNLLKGTTIVSDAKSDSWKTKKEALENLQAILDQGSNKRLKGTMGVQSCQYAELELIYVQGKLAKC